MTRPKIQPPSRRIVTTEPPLDPDFARPPPTGFRTRPQKPGRTVRPPAKPKTDEPAAKASAASAPSPLPPAEPAMSPSAWRQAVEDRVEASRARGLIASDIHVVVDREGLLSIRALTPSRGSSPA
jgi:hypothetical protein